MRLVHRLKIAVWAICDGRQDITSAYLTEKATQQALHAPSSLVSIDRQSWRLKCGLAGGGERRPGEASSVSSRSHTAQAISPDDPCDCSRCQTGHAGAFPAAHAPLIALQEIRKRTARKSQRDRGETACLTQAARAANQAPRLVSQLQFCSGFRTRYMHRLRAIDLEHEHSPRRAMDGGESQSLREIPKLRRPHFSIYQVKDQAHPNKMTVKATSVADHQMQTLQKLMPHDCAIVVEQKGVDVDLPAVQRPQGLQQRLQLDLEAHRRWNASGSVGFLNSVDRIEINETRSDDDQTVLYSLEVYLSFPTSRLPTSRCDPTECQSPTRPTFKAERCFADFEELRENVLKTVSSMPQCTCEYCMDFLVYIRYKFSQPRGLVKLLSGTEKRMQILSTFINDFVEMGQRRVAKVSKRKCEAQALVPSLLEAFLLDHASDC